MFQLLFCENPGVLRIIYLLKTTLNIIKFAIPLGLVIMVSLDLYKAMLQGVIDDKQSVIKKIGNRIIAAIIVFCIPTFVNLLFSLLAQMNIGDESYETTFAICYDQVSLTLIKQLEKEQELKLGESEETERKKGLTAAQEFLAELAALREANEKRRETSGDSIYNDTTTDMNLQNQVYIKDGTFYAPKYNADNRNTWSGRGCPGDNPESKGYNNPYGYNNYFWTMLEKFKQAAISAGYNIDFSSQGCRSYTKQYEYYQTMEKGRAASPGRSNHGWGIASDVTFYKNSSTKCGSNRTYSNCPGMKWAHDNAKNYGLTFPLINASYKEDWHLEPAKLVKY